MGADEALLHESVVGSRFTAVVEDEVTLHGLDAVLDASSVAIWPPLEAVKAIEAALRGGLEPEGTPRAASWVRTPVSSS